MYSILFVSKSFFIIEIKAVGGECTQDVHDDSIYQTVHKLMIL